MKTRSAGMWLFTVEDRGIEAAVVDKYPDLFASDPVLAQAWAQHQAARRAIDERMAEIARDERP